MSWVTGKKHTSHQIDRSYKKPSDKLPRNQHEAVDRESRDADSRSDGKGSDNLKPLQLVTHRLRISLVFSAAHPLNGLAQVSRI